MARTPKKKSDGLVVYPKQWPDTRVDKPEIDRGETVTPHLGHEYRLTKKFSEWLEMEEQSSKDRPKSARETFPVRFRGTRSKHMPHPAPIVGGHYKSTPQMEKPHYEETEAMTQKTYKDFVTEAAKRGRPRKLRPGEEADTLHLQDQLNKLTHPNHVEIHFKDGSKHRIPREHANMALHHLSSLKPIDRADHAEHMAKSHSNFYHVLSKKTIPSKKKTITLAGPKLRKEEVEQIDELKRKTLASYVKKAGGTSMDSVGGLMYQAGNADPTAKDNRRVDLFKKAGKRAKGIERAATRLAKEEREDDDGWYAHKEMHGKDAVSKEDWKKGIRKKPAMKKEEVEQIDEVSKDKLQRYMHSAAPERRDPEKGDKRKAGMKLAIKKVLGSDELGKKPKIKATKEEVEQIDEWGRQAITGPHAKTGSMAITPPKVGYKGKQKKPKVQTLNKEELEIYEALSDEGKALFEKMSPEQLAKMIATYHSKGGVITKGKTPRRKEADKSFPISKSKGTTFNKGAKRVNLQGAGVRGK